MPEQYAGDVSYGIGLKLRDLEQSNNLTKERLLLLGQNVIEAHEKANSELTKLKKQVIEMKSDLDRIKSIIESLSEEVSKSARKEDVAIISRQFKMFSPLKYARHEDVETIVHEKINKHAKTNKEENPHSFWVGKL